MQVKAKKTPEELLKWFSENKVEEEVDGKVGLLRISLRGLLAAGSKSFTHMLIALERYDDLLSQLLAGTGEQVSSILAV